MDRSGSTLSVALRGNVFTAKTYLVLTAQPFLNEPQYADRFLVHVKAAGSSSTLYSTLPNLVERMQPVAVT